MKKFWQEMRVLFSVWEMVFYLVFLFFLNYGIFMFVSEHKEVSIAVGIVGSLFFFFVFTLKNRELKVYQYNLNELLKYTNNIVFHLNIGENVFNALKKVEMSATTDVKKSIQQTVEYMDKNQVLKTDHFEDYEFPALNQFHRNLEIYFDRGGDSRKMFGRVGKNIIFELKKRDELYRKRKAFARNVYMLLFGVALMPLFIDIQMPAMWQIILDSGIVGITFLLVIYVLFLVNLYLLQQKTLDISIRL